jgi:hypothetical protein
VKKIAGSVVIGALVLAFGASAHADNCKSPKVLVKNGRSDAVKITKIAYFDRCDNKERTENVASTEIAAGGQHPFRDDLEYVGNCGIKYFKVYRAVRRDTGAAWSSYAWGAKLTPDEGDSQVCNTGVTYTVHLFE